MINLNDAIKYITSGNEILTNFVNILIKIVLFWKYIDWYYTVLIVAFALIVGFAIYEILKNSKKLKGVRFW